MLFRARELKEGATPEDLRRQMNEAFRAIERDLGAALAKGKVSQLITATTYSAGFGEVARFAPPSGGTRLILPAVNLERLDARVTAVVEAATGALSVEVVNGTINGAATLTFLAGIGTVEFILTPTGWYAWSVSLVASFPLTGLAAIAANSLVANPTGSSAVPVAHPFATLAGAGLSYAAGALAVNGSTSITVTSDEVQRAALTGFVVATANANATVLGTGAAGSGLSGDGTATLKLIGATSNVNSATTAGDLNVFDISALECGGVVTLQSLTEANIDGFTAKPDGFWFVLHIRDATTADYVSLIENSGNTTTSIRCPEIRDFRMGKGDSALLIYSNTRWRLVATVPKLWMVTADAVTWAAQQDNFARTSRGVSAIRVTLTGNQILTGVVPGADAANGGEILLIENVDTADTLTINHDATSTAANRFFCPGAANLALGPLHSSLWRYDSTSSRWRCMAFS